MTMGTPVMIFARAPVAGTVKTRLIPAIGAERAAALHAKMLRRTVETAMAAHIGGVSIWCTPSVNDPFFEALRTELGVRLAAQHGADLGARMHAALAQATAGGGGAIVVGSDCPFLEAEDLRTAARGLHEGLDVVIGPAADGGYFLVAASRADCALFDGVPWGSGDVLRATRAKLARLGWRWRELPVRHDIDRPADLALLGPEWRY